MHTHIYAYIYMHTHIHIYINTKNMELSKNVRCEPYPWAAADCNL